MLDQRDFTIRGYEMRTDDGGMACETHHLTFMVCGALTGTTGLDTNLRTLLYRELVSAMAKCHAPAQSAGRAYRRVDAVRAQRPAVQPRQ